ncbi:DUF3459 domain-containing protein [Thalassoroseus pseudoceratinae]|uniref:DUF3459 domain-containing protein n=1 Tax=Thalassoroseus pseudoceratinae TaxID=2713176 RepID=UPI0036F24B23
MLRRQSRGVAARCLCYHRWRFSGTELAPTARSQSARFWRPCRHRVGPLLRSTAGPVGSQTNPQAWPVRRRGGSVRNLSAAANFSPEPPATPAVREIPSPMRRSRRRHRSRRCSSGTRFAPRLSHDTPRNYNRTSSTLGSLRSETKQPWVRRFPSRSPTS